MTLPDVDIDVDTDTDVDMDVDSELGGSVDAVIGRLVLGHLPDPVTALRRLSGLVRPGGLVAFQDFDNFPLRVEPHTPLTGAVLETIAAALMVNGSSLGTGARLYSLFRQAGLTAPDLSATTPMGGTEDDTVLPLVVQTYRALSQAPLPGSCRAGELAETIGDVDTLLGRIRAETAEAHAVVVMPTAVTAWSVIPG
ncbi:methyltransferase domain-containing protein [Streptomyces sp. NPDC004788]